MTIAVYAGSFDPITNGHLYILQSGCKIFDKVIIAVAHNEEKKEFLPISERLKLIQECTKNFNNIEIDSFEGLTVEYAKKKNATVLLRGLRNSLDFEYEKELAQINNSLNPDIQTVFITTKPKYSYISSSAVREILANNGDTSQFVPDAVSKYFRDYHKTNLNN